MADPAAGEGLIERAHDLNCCCCKADTRDAGEAVFIRTLDDTTPVHSYCEQEVSLHPVTDPRCLSLRADVRAELVEEERRGYKRGFADAE